jgi:hypothetical protein
VVHAPLMQFDVSVCLLLLDWPSNFWYRTGIANPRAVTVDTIISIAIRLPENLTIGYTLKRVQGDSYYKVCLMLFSIIFHLKTRG